MIKVSYAYGVNPVQALEDTGHLNDNGQVSTPEQIANRIKRDADRLAAAATNDNVVPLRPDQDADVSPNIYDDDTPLRAVATTDDEDAQRGWDSEDD
ncbi:hypothetical protein CWC39_00630 [Corynebacterium heidelbergense]|uniref:Uncharacterized protein n=1 Tax=Corynebacterium heidelbergense TaxID=2055947 RepID=A0A364VE10_9CORY|nr:hypothetical protein CWC39_00630 [Corynebacterium heidelbergense]